MKKRVRRRAVRVSLVVGNVLLLLVVASFLLINRSANQTVRRSTLNNAIQTTASNQNPLDQLSSAEIAAQAAQLVHIEEATAVRNQADTENAQLSVIPSDSSIVTKPQIVATAQKSKKNIIKYRVAAGETITTIAAKFNVKPDSIKWSNGISTDKVDAGKELYIPPADGIVYQVRSGDTIDSLSSKYKADKSLFVTVNDAESGKLILGDYVWVPGGTVTAAPVTYGRAVANYDTFAFGFSANYGSNGYDYGYCTWYAANKRTGIGRPVPSNLGNAITWKSLAQRAGLGVGTTPAAGAVIWTPASYGYGHVGYVERVNSDGSAWVSDMNSHGYASMDTNSGSAGGWGRISFRLLSPGQASSFWYIY